jgi:predicted polyphosphate/ATP-dependent NAD kinase
VRLGFVVNPLAGAGGPLALKGSDGLRLDVACSAATGGHSAFKSRHTMATARHSLATARHSLATARQRAAAGWAGMRAALALAGLAGADVVLLTGGGAMGEDVAAAAGLPHAVVHRPPGLSTGADTSACVAACVAAGAALIIFVGGDGTARDVLAAAPVVPVLGVPAGVKMHSGVFATSPGAAAAMLAAVVQGRGGGIDRAEVMDRDVAGNVQLFGQLPVLAHPARQAMKAVRGDADAALAGAIAEVAAMVRAAPLSLIGPGLTMHRLKLALAGRGTLLGVDVFADGALQAEDATHAQLQALAGGALLVLGVVGGQGFLLGRGNQQLGPDVLARIQWPPLIIAAAAKLAALPQPVLLVDTGDAGLDAQLAGHVQVRTGRRQAMLMRIDAA